MIYLSWGIVTSIANNFDSEVNVCKKGLLNFILIKLWAVGNLLVIMGNKVKITISRQQENHFHSFEDIVGYCFLINSCRYKHDSLKFHMYTSSF